MKISDAVFVVVDTETTGLDPTVDQLVEIGAVATTTTEVLGMWSTFVDPEMPIPPEVSAVHGIVDSDVIGAPGDAQARRRLLDFAGAFGPPRLVAHHLEFNSAFLDIPNGLCTKRLALHLWPNYPAHKNQSLRFRRQLQVETFGIAPHRALGDALVTAALLRDELASDEFLATGIDDVVALIAYAESPILFATWPFGKYRGRPIAAAPADYVSWCLRSMADLSRDMRYTLEQRLKAA